MNALVWKQMNFFARTEKTANLHNDMIETVSTNKSINSSETLVVSVSQDEWSYERVQTRLEKVGNLFAEQGASSHSTGWRWFYSRHSRRGLDYVGWKSVALAGTTWASSNRTACVTPVRFSWTKCRRTSTQAGDAKRDSCNSNRVWCFANIFLINERLSKSINRGSVVASVQLRSSRWRVHIKMNVESKELFTCNVCDEKFTTAGRLSSHEKKTNVHDGMRGNAKNVIVFACGVCDQGIP